MGTKERISFCINGEWKELAVDGRASLLRVLREELRLTGTKCGCDGGECGACSVLLDGRLRLSCRMPMEAVQGRAVTTIEGLGTPDCLHPIQQAFVESGAIQCGFCTPGMILSAKALLDRNPHPSEDEIKKALAHNLCRCTGYVKIIEAVALAARLLHGARAGRGEDGNIGLSIPLRDATQKATGLARYGDDLVMPGMLHGKVVRSPHAHARILKVDAAAAAALPGVAAVLTAKDIPNNAYGRFVKDQPVLCGDRVRCAGDPVVLVVAETETQAEAAAARVEVLYEPLPGVSDAQTSLWEGPPIYTAGNLCLEKTLRVGDAAQGLRDSGIILEKTYQTHFAAHAYLEPEAGIGFIDEQGRVAVIAGSQNSHVAHQEIAYVLNLPLDRLRLLQPVIGGGFGGKQDLAIHALLALAAFKLRRPIKIRYSRRESMATTSKRHPYRMELAVGAKKDGTLIAIRADYIANTGAYTGNAPGVFGRSLIHIPGPYNFPNVDLSLKGVFTNNPPAGAMRGFGVPQVALALECHLDELARRLGIDAWELRYRNALTEEHVLPTGEKIPGRVEMRRCLEAIRPDYDEMRRAIKGQGPAGIRYGVGLAAAVYGIGITGLRSPGRARVSLEEDGLVIRTAVAELGQGVATTLAQMAAEAFGFPLPRVRVSWADTATDPDTGPTSASRQTYFTGNAMLAGLGKLSSTIRDFAPKIFERPVAGITFSGDRLYPAGEPKLSLAIAEFVAMARERGVRLEAEGIYDPEEISFDLKTGKGRPYPAYTFGAQVAEVAVEEATGRLEVRRIVAVQDVWRAINPAIVEGQIHGSIVMALGWTLQEIFIPGKTESFAAYPILRSTGIPKIKIILLENGEAGAPFGAKGVGEGALLPTAPTILNAIADATGKRCYEIPVRPARNCPERPARESDEANQTIRPFTRTSKN